MQVQMYPFPPLRRKAAWGCLSAQLSEQDPGSESFLVAERVKMETFIH